MIYVEMIKHGIRKVLAVVHDNVTDRFVGVLYFDDGKDFIPYATRSVDSTSPDRIQDDMEADLHIKISYDRVMEDYNKLSIPSKKGKRITLGADGINEDLVDPHNLVGPAGLYAHGILEEMLGTDIILQPVEYVDGRICSLISRGIHKADLIINNDGDKITVIIYKWAYLDAVEHGLVVLPNDKKGIEYALNKYRHKAVLV